MSEADFRTFVVDDADQVWRSRFQPLPYSNQELGECKDLCHDGHTPCKDWSNPYGCGGCCFCLGCLKGQWEQYAAPFVWEGDDG